MKQAASASSWLVSSFATCSSSMLVDFQRVHGVMTELFFVVYIFYKYSTQNQFISPHYTYSRTTAFLLTRFDSNHELPNVFHMRDRIYWMREFSIPPQKTEVSVSTVENEAMNLKA
jgi:hypothetical protein